MAATRLVHLRHKFLVGDYWDDAHSLEGNRLLFYRWLYVQKRLSDFA